MCPISTESPVLFLSHEASRTGAPLVLLNLLKWFKRHTDLPFRVVLFQDGALASEFAKIAPTVVLTEVGPGKSRLLRLIGRIPVAGAWLKKLWHSLISPRAVGGAPGLVYANTVGTARLIRQLVPPKTPLIVHVHELERAIQIAAQPEGMNALKGMANRFVAISSPVRENLIRNHGIDGSMIDVVPSFVPAENLMVVEIDRQRQAMRDALGIPRDAMVVGGCGGTDWRKGTDLFVDMARIVTERRVGQPTHFVWVGKVLEDEFTRAVMRRVQVSGLRAVFHFAGEHPRPIEMFCGFDVFVLSSREEPMGMVALEAAAVGAPVVCFAGAGGMPDFVGDECGRVVSPQTGEALAGAVVELLGAPDLRGALGRRAAEKVRATHREDVIAPRILELIKTVAGT